VRRFPPPLQQPRRVFRVEASGVDKEELSHAPCPIPIYVSADAIATSEREYLSRMNIEVANLIFF
jgi:hypothetical protein